MVKAKSYLPEGTRTVTPSLVVNGAAEAIEYYKRALGASERHRMAGPDGKILHAEIQIGDSVVHLSDEFPNMGPIAWKSPQSLGGTSMGIHLYVPDCDAVYRQAIEAGGTPVMPPQDMFWGDRYGQFADPFGHMWAIGTRVEDLTPEEMEQRGREAMERMRQAR